MSKRFTRNILSIKDIEKQPKSTNEQNDLLSDEKDVYIRNQGKYEKITGNVEKVNNKEPDDKGNVEIDTGVHKVNGKRSDDKGNVKIDTGVMKVNGKDPDNKGNVDIEGGSGIKTVTNVAPDENGNVNLQIKDFKEQEKIVRKNQLEEFNETITKQLAQNVIHADEFKRLDDEPDDSGRLQRAIDLAHSQNKPLRLNGGVYEVFMIDIPTGFHLDGGGVIFKKPDLSSEPYNMPPSHMKWKRMFQMIDYSNDEDSELTIIDNCTFDGNMWSMWDTPSFEQQQASLFIVYASSDKKGRVRINFDNCHFRNNVSDGIHIRNNVEAQITNCSSFDCFRGGLVITGGYSEINVDNFNSNSELVNDGFDVEVDGKGYRDTYKTNINMNNIFIDTDFDIDVPENSVVNVNNLQMNKKKGYLSLRSQNNSRLKITNSQLVSFKPNANKRAIRAIGEVKFINCDFHLRNNEDIGSNLIYVYFAKNDEEGIKKISFIDCGFYNDLPLEEGHKLTGVSGSGSKTGEMFFIRCFFGTNITNGIRGNFKKLLIKDTTFNTLKYGIEWVSNQYNPDNEVIFYQNEFSHEMESILYMWGSKATIINYDSILDESTPPQITGENINSYILNETFYTIYKGKRIIYVTDENIDNVKGLLGDIAISKTPIKNGRTRKWECIETGANWLEITRE